MIIFSWHLEHRCLLSEDQLISADLASAFLTPQGMLKDYFRCLFDVRTSLLAQTVKCLSTMRETRVQSLGGEDPLEKEMAIHSSTIAWKIPWTEDPGRL